MARTSLAAFYAGRAARPRPAPARPRPPGARFCVVAASAVARRLAPMPQTDSQLRRARALLAPRPDRPESLVAVTAAAAFFAVSAMALAVTVVLMPTPWPT
jgi:hypothetical protein